MASKYKRVECPWCGTPLRRKSSKARTGNIFKVQYECANPECSLKYTPYIWDIERTQQENRQAPKVVKSMQMDNKLAFEKLSKDLEIIAKKEMKRDTRTLNKYKLKRKLSDARVDDTNIDKIAQTRSLHIENKLAKASAEKAIFPQKTRLANITMAKKLTTGKVDMANLAKIEKTQGLKIDRSLREEEFKADTARDIEKTSMLQIKKNLTAELIDNQNREIINATRILKIKNTHDKEEEKKQKIIDNKYFNASKLRLARLSNASKEEKLNVDRLVNRRKGEANLIKSNRRLRQEQFKEEEYARLQPTKEKVSKLAAKLAKLNLKKQKRELKQRKKEEFRASTSSLMKRLLMGAMAGGAWKLAPDSWKEGIKGYAHDKLVRPISNLYTGGQNTTGENVYARGTQGLGMGFGMKTLSNLAKGKFSLKSSILGGVAGTGIQLGNEALKSSLDLKEGGYGAQLTNMASDIATGYATAGVPGAVGGAVISATQNITKLINSAINDIPALMKSRETTLESAKSVSATLFSKKQMDMFSKEVDTWRPDWIESDKMTKDWNAINELKLMFNRAKSDGRLDPAEKQQIVAGVDAVSKSITNPYGLDRDVVMDMITRDKDDRETLLTVTDKTTNTLEELKPILNKLADLLKIQGPGGNMVTTQNVTNSQVFQYGTGTRANRFNQNMLLR